MRGDLSVAAVGHRRRKEWRARAAVIDRRYSVVLALVLVAWTPVITHPVKDEATHEMLREVARENDRVVREEAQEALDFIAGKAVTNHVVALPVVETATWSDADVMAKLQSPEILRQEAAVRAVRDRSLTNAVPVLVALLDDEDERLRGAVSETLAALRRLEVEPSARIRRALVAVLLAVRDAATLRSVLDLMQHERWQAREAAAQAVEKWGDRELALRLVPLLSDASEPVQVAAGTALAALRHPETEAALLARLPAAADAVKPVMMTALGNLRSVAAVPALIEFATGTNDVLGVAAAEALSQIEDDRIVPAFRQVIYQVTYLQMETRVVALRQLRERRDAALADRMTQFVTEQVVPPPPMAAGPMMDSVEARMEALRYLLVFGQAKHGARLLERLQEPVPGEMRPLLAETLTKLTGRPYRPVPDQNYRRYFVESRGPSPYASAPTAGVVLEEAPREADGEEQQGAAATADEERQQSR